MRVISYARFSTDRQTEASTADQQRVCRELAAARGWTIAAEYIDEGISGAALGNRPGVLAGLASLDTGDVLLIADTTRLARSQDLAPLITRLRFRGVRVIGVLDGFDSETEHAQMQAGLSGLMSEDMRKNIARRVHSALQMRAKAGTATGGRAYGFDNAGNPTEPEASHVREAFARAADGEPMRAIVTDFNARGIPSPGAVWKRTEKRTDGRWLISAMHAILRNDRYVGRVVWNRSVWVKDPDSGRRIRRERPESEWVVREGVALIDRAVWDRVQARANERTQVFGAKRGNPPKYLLSGILTCEACGNRMIASGKGSSHFYCGMHRQGGDTACSMGIGARRDVAEELILGPMQQAVLSPAAEARAVDLIATWFREERVEPLGTDTAVAQLDAELAQLELLAIQNPALAGTLRDAAEGVRARRTAAQRAAWRKAAASVVPEVDAAVAAYRAVVREMREVIAGPSGLDARGAVRDILGGSVPCRPEPEGRYLIAQVGVTFVPLFRRAGVIASIGSGGVLPIGAIHLVRAA